MALKKGPAVLALFGAIVGGSLWASVEHFEGVKQKPYADIVGVLTVCAGHTGKGIDKGKYYSEDECSQLLDVDLISHAKQAESVTPILFEKDPLTGELVYPWQAAAVTSFVFNVGVGNFSKSTAARKFNSGDFKGGCEALAMYDKARVGGRDKPLIKVRGLTIRRDAEVEMCLQGL